MKYEIISTLFFLSLSRFYWSDSIATKHRSGKKIELYLECFKNRISLTKYSSYSDRQQCGADTKWIRCVNLCVVVDCGFLCVSFFACMIFFFFLGFVWKFSHINISGLWNYYTRISCVWLHLASCWPIRGRCKQTLSEFLWFWTPPHWNLSIDGITWW